MKNSGFTMTEMAVTIGIVSIIALITIQGFKLTSDLKGNIEGDNDLSTLIDIFRGKTIERNCLNFLPLAEIDTISEGGDVLINEPLSSKFKIDKSTLVDIRLLKTDSNFKVFSSLIKIQYTFEGLKRSGSFYIGVVYFKTDPSNKVIACSNTPTF